MANFENISIEKGMYQTKGGLTTHLKNLIRLKIIWELLLRAWTHFQDSLSVLTSRLRAEAVIVLRSFFRPQIQRLSFPNM